LILRAVGVDHFFNPVITVSDANLLLSENQKTHFLDQTAVVFVR